VLWYLDKRKERKKTIKADVRQMIGGIKTEGDYGFRPVVTDMVRASD
jgi:hypothetical protein